MTKIEELKDNLKVVLDATEDTDIIQKLAAINNIVCDIETEQNKMVESHSELKRAYKEAVMHGGMVKQEPVKDVAVTAAPDFNTMLQDFMSKNN